MSACQNGTTTSDIGQSSCNANCDNINDVNVWNDASWNDDNRITNLCSISSCNSCYKLESNRCNTQTTLYVSNSGNDSNGGYETSSPFATINKAYTCPGNITIKLLSNIVQDNEAKFNTLNKEVILTSNEGTYTITRGNGLTSGSIIELSNKGELTTTNITFDGNNVESSKELLSVSDSSTINLNSGTTVENGINSSVSNGHGASGGIGLSSSTINVNGATIKNNTGGKGGGIKIAGGSLNFSDGTVTGNKAIYGDYAQGGGIWLWTNYGSFTSYISSGAINNNSSPFGAGIWLGVDGVGPVNILNVTNTTISNNTASDSGGGIFQNGGTLNISGGIIENNKASQVAGAIRVNYGTATITGSAIIRNNTATSNGGAIDLNGGGFEERAILNLDDGTLSGNTSLNGYGGGILCGVGGTFNFTNGTISNNSCGYNSVCGGGLSKNATCSYSKTGGTYSGNTPQDYTQG